MARIVYVNGRYLPYPEAGVHVEDRGFQFADSVYEVCEVKDGALVDTTRHLARLGRSLSELKIASPMSDRALQHILARSFAATASATASSTCKSPAARPRAIFSFPQPRHQPSSHSHAPSIPKKSPPRPDRASPSKACPIRAGDAAI